MRLTNARRAGLTAIFSMVFLTTLALAGCSSTPAPAPSSSNSNFIIPSSGKLPEFVPDGTAEYNVTYLAYVVAQTQAKDPKLDAPEVAEKVASSGFARAGIQFTYGATAAGLDADSMYVAVPWGDKCMIAQYGPVITGVHTAVLPVLKQGGCLIGPTVQTLR